MMRKNIFAPTVLLLDETSAVQTTRNWLENRGYNVQQVDGIHDVIDTIVDFTLDARPSLVLLNLTRSSEVCAEKLRLLQDISDFEDLPLVSLSKTQTVVSDGKMLTIENLESLQPLMNKFLTKAYAKAA